MAAWTTRTWVGSPKIVSVTGTGYDAEAKTLVFADPTFDERNLKEKFAVPVTEAELKAIASGKPGSPASHIVIVTKK